MRQRRLNDKMTIFPDPHLRPNAQPEDIYRGQKVYQRIGQANRYNKILGHLGCCCRSFVGLTAEAVGIAQIASASFTNNSNGTYTIKTSGNATTIVLRGVGKTPLIDETFPIYDMTVTASSQIPEKIN